MPAKKPSKPKTKPAVLKYTKVAEKGKGAHSISTYKSEGGGATMIKRTAPKSGTSIYKKPSTKKVPSTRFTGITIPPPSGKGIKRMPKK